MKRYMLIQKYSFNQAFDIYDKQKFCDCFFNDPNVINSLKVIQNEQWNILGKYIIYDLGWSRVALVLPDQEIKPRSFDS